MKTITPFILLAILLSTSCKMSIDTGSVETWKQEIVDTEKDFATMAKDVGLTEAFLHYAAEDAVLQRGTEVVSGIKEIALFLGSQVSPGTDESLSWKPDFVDVAASGDLGYTYGQYTYSFTDSSGTRQESKGIFHTVWKRQADGSWRFVWD